MLRLILALTLSVVAMLLIEPRALVGLRKFRHTVYALGPAHQDKQGTPTMGGLMFVGVACSLALLLHGKWFGLADMGLALVVFSLLSMLIGFLDDYRKVARKQNLGLLWWQKLLGQVLLGLLFSLYCYVHPNVGASIRIPFTNAELHLGWWYVPLMTLVIMFMINSANLQDGLDGLLSSVSATGNFAWAALALLTDAAMRASNQFLAGNAFNVAVFALALAGACIGFLWVNFHPAKVFMGDTGSMFIGGATVGMAMLLRLPILLLLVAFTMIMSSVSVILQRTYFKLTHGKRIFRMSPIHHHFEKLLMTEPQIVAMYTAVTAILSVIAVLAIGWVA